jgi:poly-gamma-glutamate capsule biosynthesis protein CapA/YwtB (metallophosphatase superfamily)
VARSSTVALVGDVMLGRLVNEYLRGAPPEYPWGDTLPLLRAADAVVANLECVIADRGEPWPGKVFVFRTDPKNVLTLAVARVTVVSLANNHSLDYGAEALLDCLAILRRQGIGAAGAGATLGQARQPAFFRVGGARAALVAFTDNEPAWEAGEHSPGIFYAPLDEGDPRFRAVLDLIAAARQEAELVVVSAHWGPNWGSAPLPEHVAAAHRFVEAGADIVFGHSPHILRGIEIYRNRPILYSCGDFVDDYAVDEVERNDESAVFLVHLEGNSVVRLVVVPTLIRRFQARLATHADRDRILARVRSLCARLGTQARETAEGVEIAVA